MVNRNPETMIRYGVISGNSVPELLEDILTCGQNLSEEERDNEEQESLQTALKNALAEWNPECADILEDIVDQEGLAGQVRDCLMERDVGDEAIEEPVMTYELDTREGEIKLRLDWLGGAPLIYVLESPWLMECRPCSPCIPGAGDLNSPAGDSAGVRAYSLNKAEMPVELKNCPRLTNTRKARPRVRKGEKTGGDTPEGSYTVHNETASKDVREKFKEVTSSFLWKPEISMREALCREYCPGESLEGIFVQPGVTPVPGDYIYSDADIPDMQWHVTGTFHNEMTPRSFPKDKFFPEIGITAVLSTAHLSDRDRERLLAKGLEDTPGTQDPGVIDIPVTAPEGVTVDDLMEDGYSMEFVSIYSKAVSYGISWVRFDPDGPLSGQFEVTNVS